MSRVASILASVLVAACTSSSADMRGHGAGSPSDVGHFDARDETGVGSDAEEDAGPVPSAEECEAAKDADACADLGCTYFVTVYTRTLDNDGCTAPTEEELCLVTVSGSDERGNDALVWYYRGEDASYKVFGATDLGVLKGWTLYFDYPDGQAPCTDGRP